MKRINLHIYPSPYKFETRINKEVNSILEMDLADQIIIAGTWAAGLKESELQSDKIKIRRIKTIVDSLRKNVITKVLGVLFFNIRTFIEFRNQKLSHINCHSLWVLPLCVLLKKMTKAKLIYDAHELETERVGLYGVKQKLAKWLEKSLIKHTDSIIVVGHLIAEWYKKEYDVEKLYVIRNVPQLGTATNKKSNLLREKFNIPSSDLIYIYQGVINKGRGIDIMLDAFKNVATNNHLVIMGFGALENKVIYASKDCQNIHFMPAVKPHEIPIYTSGADVGLIVAENLGLSYYYGMPNKLFEYLYCGLPVITSNFPEMGKIVNDYQCGWTISPEVSELANKINQMDLNRMQEKKILLSKLYNDINWEEESQNLKFCF